MKLATITSVHNEDVLLPQFLRHYSQEADAMFILDNETSDRSLDACRPYKSVQVSRYESAGEFKESLKRRKIEEKRRECIGLFDYVLVVDCDEFISSKSGSSIKQTLKESESLDVHWTHGFNMFSKAGWTYDPALPLIQQLTTGFEDPGYAKPVIIRPDSPHVFDPGMHSLHGFHKVSFEHIKKSPFILRHFVGIDEETFVRRSMIRSTRLSSENRALGISIQYYSQSEAHYREVFKNRSQQSKELAEWLNIS